MFFLEVNPLVLPDIGLVVWSTLAFSIVLFVLGKFAWGPLLSTLQERESFIHKSLADAKHEREQAEEVVMEAFARTLEAWGRLRNVDDPYPYVRRAVVNLARSGLRRRMVGRRVRLAAVPDAPGSDVVVLAAESRSELVGAVRSLPRRQRECVVLRYFEDCSTDQTADVLGISPGSVKTHLHRALQALEQSLESTR